MNIEDYVGKRALLGITYRDKDGAVTEKVQVHGVIQRVNEKGWLVLERADGGGELEFPPQLERAKPGEYELKSTGEVVKDPDYLAVFTVEHVPPPAADA